ncbi:hypothetical protein DB346_13105 [Verrucomicrobia bacterium LW23]|nr:hypothetical protein DB346_13105 [Verrucomicrobia bacterium LW23]
MPPRPQQPQHAYLPTGKVRRPGGIAYYEPVPVERRYLVQRVPAEVERLTPSVTYQGWLSLDPHGVEICVRQSGAECMLTFLKKQGQQLKLEEEMPVSRSQFDKLWLLSAGRRLTRLRYTLQAPGCEALHVDVYQGKLGGLVTATVRFANADACQRFRTPDWIGDDVTGDPRYTNETLAQV